MIRKNILVVNKLGLHARAASCLVKEASRYACDIQLCREGQKVDAKSIMGIMMLAASKGTELELIADGEDETLATTSIVDLFANRFGEEE